MSLTSFPTILFNSSTGSDTAASGAGPATAVTGTCAASTNTTTVTFNASPDLSGVAQDGTAVLWVSGIGFVRISTVDNVGKTCVVETALTISAGTSFAIGGKRATLDNTESRRLFAATASPTASGAAARWTISLEDNQTITSAITLATGGTTNLYVVSSVAGTRRTITQSGNAVHFSCTTANRITFRDFLFLNSNVTKNHVFSTTNQISLSLENCVIGANSGTNCPAGIVIRLSGSTPILSLYNCAAILCSSSPITGATALLTVTGCEFSRNGATAITFTPGGAVRISDSIFAYNSGDGVNFGSVTSPILIERCTFDGNTGDGIELTQANTQKYFQIINNQITNNGGYGLNLSGTTPHDALVEYNNFYLNSTAAANGVTLSSTNTTANPNYTDRTNTVRNYSVGTSMKATGFPAAVGAGQSGTTSYVDIGAAQRQEAGGYARRPR